MTFDAAILGGSDKPDHDVIPSLLRVTLLNPLLVIPDTRSGMTSVEESKRWVTLYEAWYYIINPVT